MGVDLSSLVSLLEQRREEGWHTCAQVYVSLGGEVLLDAAVGETRPGRAEQTDDVMLWYSAGKPLTTVAVLQLWERGRLGLDDRVATFLPGWGNGKERCTLRHVLTHTGGFPMWGDGGYDRDLTFAESLAATVAAPAQWEPGTVAAYHASSGWRVLGGVVEAVDGRPIDRYLQEEVLGPVGMTSSSLGIPLAVQAELGDRIVPVVWTGHMLPTRDPDGGIRMVPYKIDKWHNEPWHVAKVEPGGGMRGPARELGGFYEALLGTGPALLEPRTVEVMTAIHRYGMKDRTFGFDIPWGLGVQRQFSGGPGRRAFGHGGMASSHGLADPDLGLVMVVVANGLAGFFDAEQRNLEITDGVYSALGEDAARVRTPLLPIRGRSLST
ncbi:MAG TPA: serine hydrolase domain-containing protein [Acidimicrobiia bacterium]|nr:serine hydrolase domain-containing protein [Acidimicrobiia bacterium]